MAALLFCVHIVLGALTYVDLDASHKYHDFAGVQGLVLFVVKLLIWFYFLYAWSKSSKELERRSQPYFKKLLYVGSSHLLALPVAIMVTWFY